MTHLWLQQRFRGALNSILSFRWYSTSCGIMQRGRSSSGYRTILLLIWLGILAGCAGSPPQTAEPVVQAKSESRTHEPVQFIHPLPGARVSSSFARYIVKSRNRQHHGVDFAAPSGTPVFAASAGVVLSADNTSLSEAFGNAVLIEHGDQLTSLSAHLSRLDVKLGEWVQAGQQIGLVGQTGRATGPHLHFEVWRGSVPQDPITLIPLSPKERQQAMAEMQRQAAASLAKPSSSNRQIASVQTAKSGSRKAVKTSVAKKTVAKNTAANKAVPKKATAQSKIAQAKTTQKKAAQKQSTQARVTVAKHTSYKVVSKNTGKAAGQSAAKTQSAMQTPAKAVQPKKGAAQSQAKTADAG